jgi:hypothetical protein
MALRKQFISTSNLIAKTEYGEVTAGQQDIALNPTIKITQIKGSKEKLSITVEFSDSKIVFYKNYSFSPDMNGANFIAQAYMHLKTLPEFAGATDC